MKTLTTKQFDKLKKSNKIDTNNKLYFLDSINNHFELECHHVVFNIHEYHCPNLSIYNLDNIEIILVTDSKEFVTRMKEKINENISNRR